MTETSPIARLTNIIDAIELIRGEMEGVTLAAFETDRRKRWLAAEAALQGKRNLHQAEVDAIGKRHLEEVVRTLRKRDGGHLRFSGPARSISSEPGSC